VSNDFQQHDWNATIDDDLRQIVRLSVREDLDRGQDWTTVALVDAEATGRAVMVARQAGVIGGLLALPVVVDEMHADIEVQPRASDGDEVAAGTVLAEVSGSARDMLTCERPMLNLVGRLSGIASLTSEFVKRVEGTGARIYDTRKTIPGWRRLEKYAVRCGGGCNHRTGLFDAILIKDNHLAVAAGDSRTPAEAVRRAREFAAALPLAFARPEWPGYVAGDSESGLPIEVEVERLEQIDDVLRAGPDIVLLDNMRLDELREAVARRNELAPQVELEASGGVSLGTVREIALTGVERISTGSLTHTVRWLDVALDWIRPGG
jgi:nicotinate-nucleotide pyrophosphorylase (carboxylating)